MSTLIPIVTILAVCYLFTVHKYYKNKKESENEKRNNDSGNSGKP